jgi:hypothetical protein
LQSRACSGCEEEEDGLDGVGSCVIAARVVLTLVGGGRLWPDRTCALKIGATWRGKRTNNATNLDAAREGGHGRLGWATDFLWRFPPFDAPCSGSHCSAALRFAFAMKPQRARRSSGWPHDGGELTRRDETRPTLPPRSATQVPGPNSRATPVFYLPQHHHHTQYYPYLKP